MPVEIVPADIDTAQELTEDLTTAELAEALRQLRFTKNDRSLIALDKGVRDFILNALKERRPR
jgi:hypothetical protein